MRAVSLMLGFFLKDEIEGAFHTAFSQLGIDI
jgi:hypothetical protein